MTSTFLRGVAFALQTAALCLATGTAFAAEKLVLASTTSTQNSGLYDYLLPKFTAETGIRVDVVAVGTGQAIKIAENGDADVLIVHHRPSEDAFVKAGFGQDRRDVMYNDFVLVGPKNDPAGIRSSDSAAEALSRLASQTQIFISRGDESGTHKKELALWADAQVTPDGDWYREIGSGMGAALNMASAVDGYVLSDRGTWLSFNNRGDLEILLSGDKAMHNPYGIVTVSPEKHPHVNIAGAESLTNWITSKTGQDLIAEFEVDGQQLFCPIAQVMAETICPSNIID